MWWRATLSRVPAFQSASSLKIQHVHPDAQSAPVRGSEVTRYDERETMRNMTHNNTWSLLLTANAGYLCTRARALVSCLSVQKGGKKKSLFTHQAVMWTGVTAIWSNRGQKPRNGWIVGSAFPVSRARVALLGLGDTGLEPSWLTWDEIWAMRRLIRSAKNHHNNSGGGVKVHGDF